MIDKLTIKRRYRYPLPIYIIILILLLLSQSVRSAVNMHLYGALVAEPCVIPPGEENITLDFGAVIDKYLYINNRTPGQAFVINLTQCDLSLGNVVDITFTGKESPNLTGMLALAPESQASGVAIGMETPDGNFLPLNKKVQSYPLAAGTSAVTVHAYLQGEPAAIINERIVPGPFSAVATFNLKYQ
ncbi:fimbrial protein [Erwinia sorbitola]|uniref:fimbrial protein n=1 Tax=Erwinia sorbitola TaxID=2681984 RepID=UPI0012B94E41|nr:fimbrial protein [Erwinia sorbitola]